MLLCINLVKFKIVWLELHCFWKLCIFGKKNQQEKVLDEGRKLKNSTDDFRKEQVPSKQPKSTQTRKKEFHPNPHAESPIRAPPPHRRQGLLRSTHPRTTQAEAPAPPWTRGGRSGWPGRWRPSSSSSSCSSRPPSRRTRTTTTSPTSAPSS